MRDTRIEILAACGVGEGAKVAAWQTGVRYVEELPADLLAFTPDRTGGAFSPTTRYRDYAISRDLIHRESQSVTRADSETGRRYQDHARRGSHVLLFARLNTAERAFHFLGPATYVRHESEQPMAITWKWSTGCRGICRRLQRRSHEEETLQPDHARRSMATLPVTSRA